MRKVVGVLCLGAIALGLVAGPGTARRTTFPGPDGRLVFAKDGALVTVNPDGSDRRTPVARSSTFSVQEPAWSPTETGSCSPTGSAAAAAGSRS